MEVFTTLVEVIGAILIVSLILGIGMLVLTLIYLLAAALVWVLVISFFFPRALSLHRQLRSRGYGEASLIDAYRLQLQVGPMSRHIPFAEEFAALPECEPTEIKSLIEFLRKLDLE